MSVTREQIGAALEKIKIVGQCIQAAGEIPSGHLYAQLMAKGMELAEYEKIIGLLVRGGIVVQERSGLLKWNVPVEG